MGAGGKSGRMCGLTLTGEWPRGTGNSQTLPGRPAGMCHLLSMVCLCPVSWLTAGPLETGPRNWLAVSKGVNSRNEYEQDSLSGVSSQTGGWASGIPPRFYYSSHRECMSPNLASRRLISDQEDWSWASGSWMCSLSVCAFPFEP